MSNKVIITGANGFIGSHIVKLFLDKGVGVTCLVRKDSDLDAIKGLNVEFKYGDICDRQTVIDAFKGHDFVIHNAAYVKDWGDYNTFYQTNVEGTLNILNACAINGIKDITITGTNAVYGEEHSMKVKSEESPYNSHYQYFLDRIFPCKLNYYRDTKCLATQKAMDFAGREGMNLTILEPVWVYGENGANTVFIQYVKSIEEGLPLLPGSRKNKFHVVYVADVARAYYLAFTKRLEGIHRIIIGDHEREYMDNVLSLFCEYAGIKKSGLLPKWMVYPVGFISELLCTVLNTKNPPLLTRGRVNMFYDNIEYSTHNAERLLGFKSSYGLRDGIKNTVSWYKERTGKEGIRVRIHRSVAEVGEDEWDAIVGKGRIFCTHKYVEALEKSGISGGRCYYPVVYDGDKIVAHACAYSIDTEIDLFARGSVKKIVQMIRRKWKNFFVLRSLECGPPISLGSALSFKDGVDRVETMRLICHAIEGLAKELRIKFIVFRDFYNEEMKFFDILKERGYMKINNLPKAELKVRWKSFGEYLDSMRSNYKCKIVKKMDKCAKAGISFKVMEDISGNSRELKRLYDNVCDHAKEVKREHVDESFFRNIDKYFGKRSAVLSAVKDDKLLGFMLVVFDDKTLISTFLGLDYDHNRQCSLYFNLFYKTIELAIENGMEKIDMGITSLDPKKDMGSDVVSLNMYMKHDNRLLNNIFPALLDVISPADTSGPRNVFKDETSPK